jgi:hypothetical protein
LSISVYKKEKGNRWNLLLALLPNYTQRSPGTGEAFATSLDRLPRFFCSL